MRTDRRTLLASIAATAPLAGCIGDDGDPSDDGEPADDADPQQGIDDGSDDGSEDDTDDGSEDGADDATVQVAEHDDLGRILVDAEGSTLYQFDSDEQGASESTCYDDCADAWPPLTIDGDDPTAGDDVTADLTTHEREDGSVQVAADGWPLYYWQGDGEPGDATGQGVNDVWWVLRPDGTVYRGEDEDGDDSIY